MSTFRKFPGASPPLALTALAAVAATVMLQGAALGLFHRASADPWLAATPALERQLAGCQVNADRAGTRQCRLAVVARAREDQAVMRVAAR